MEYIVSMWRKTLLETRLKHYYPDETLTQWWNSEKTYFGLIPWFEDRLMSTIAFLSYFHMIVTIAWIKRQPGWDILHLLGVLTMDAYLTTINRFFDTHSSRFFSYPFFDSFGIARLYFLDIPIQISLIVLLARVMMNFWQSFLSAIAHVTGRPPPVFSRVFRSNETILNRYVQVSSTSKR